MDEYLKWAERRDSQERFEGLHDEAEDLVVEDAGEAAKDQKGARSSGAPDETKILEAILNDANAAREAQRKKRRRKKGRQRLGVHPDSDPDVGDSDGEPSLDGATDSPKQHEGELTQGASKEVAQARDPVETKRVPFAPRIIPAMEAEKLLTARDLSYNPYRYRKRALRVAGYLLAFVFVILFLLWVVFVLLRHYYGIEFDVANLLIHEETTVTPDGSMGIHSLSPNVELEVSAKDSSVWSSTIRLTTKEDPTRADNARRQLRRARRGPLQSSSTSAASPAIAASSKSWWRLLEDEGVGGTTSAPTDAPVAGYWGGQAPRTALEFGEHMLDDTFRSTGYISSTDDKLEIRSGTHIFLNPQADSHVAIGSNGRNTRVGVGLDSPQERMHVDGNARVDGVLLIRNTTLDVDENSTLRISSPVDVAGVVYAPSLNVRGQTETDSILTATAEVTGHLDVSRINVVDAIDISNATIVSREFEPPNVLGYLGVGALNVSRVSFEQFHLRLIHNLTIEEGLGITGNQLISEGDIRIENNRDSQSKTFVMGDVVLGLDGHEDFVQFDTKVLGDEPLVFQKSRSDGFAVRLLLPQAPASADVRIQLPHHLSSPGTMVTTANLDDIVQTGPVTSGSIEIGFGPITTSDDISTASGGRISASGDLRADTSLSISPHGVVAGAVIAVRTNQSFVRIESDAASAANEIQVETDGAVDGQLLLINNSDEDFTTGDFLIPPSKTVLLLFDGQQWQEVTGSSEIFGITELLAAADLDIGNFEFAALDLRARSQPQNHLAVYGPDGLLQHQTLIFDGTGILVDSILRVHPAALESDALGGLRIEATAGPVLVEDVSISESEVSNVDTLLMHSASGQAAIKSSEGLLLQAASGAVQVENVSISNDSIQLSGSVLLSSPGMQSIIHTGTSASTGNDLSVSSVHGNVMVENVEFASDDIIVPGQVSARQFKHHDAIEMSSDSDAVVIEDVTMDSGALFMGGALTLENAVESRITHNSATGFLSIVSDNGSVQVEGLTVDGTSVSGVSAIVLDQVVSRITHTGSSSLQISSSAGTIAVEDVTFSGPDLTGARDLELLGGIAFPQTTTQVIRHEGGDGTGDLSVISTAGNVVVENVHFSGSELSSITKLSMAGDITNSAGDFVFSSTGPQAISHTGANGADFSIVSTNGNVVVEGVSFQNRAVSGISSVDVDGDLTTSKDQAAITHTGGTSLTVSSLSGPVVVEDIEFNSGTMSMTGDITSTAGSIKFSSAGAQRILHTGAPGADLEITSGGNVLVDGITAANSALSGVSTLDMDGDLTTTAGNMIFSSAGTQSILHAGSIGEDLNIASSNGNVVVEGTTFQSAAVSGVSSLSITDDLNMAKSAASITHSGASSLAIESLSGTVAVENVLFDGSSMALAGDLTSENGDMLFTSSVRQSITHAGGAGQDLVITSGGNVVVEEVTISTTAMKGISAMEISGDLTSTAGDILLSASTQQSIRHNGATNADLAITSTNGHVVIEGVTIESGALSGSTSLEMSDDMTMSKNQGVINHSGTTSLTISSTSGTVAVEGVAFDGSSVSGVSTLDLSRDLTSASGDVLLTATSAQAITHTGAAGADLSISSVNGNVLVEGVTVEAGCFFQQWCCIWRHNHVHGD
ncbi:Uncharacterized protein SCF082_LOCUS51719 [Durusdinium trenchii]|uniref:Adhesin domain-containing protein n=1 Tax=Durusdinium trenchii TaxID=1381693 RepID=A0ABP0SGD6_9DINO